MNTQPEALRLADKLAYESVTVYDLYQAAEELRRLHEYELGYEEYANKTNWLLSDSPTHELGMHRADILKQRIDCLHEVNQELIEALEEVVAYCEEHGHSWSVLMEAKAALAKARGTE